MLEKKPLEAVGHALGRDILTEHSLDMLSLSGFSIFIQAEHTALKCTVQGTAIACRYVTLLYYAMHFMLWLLTAMAARSNGVPLSFGLA